MPFVSKAGNVVHGKGGMGAFYNNVQFDYGGGPCWLNKSIGDIAVYQHGGAGETGETWYLQFYNVHSGEMWRAIQDPANPFYGMGFNFLSADGGVWAAQTVIPGVGLWASTGLHLPYAGLIGVGPQGEIAFKPDYQSNGPVMVREQDGVEWLLSYGVVYDLWLLGQRRAIWTEGPQSVRVHELPEPMILPGGCWSPKALFMHGEWWITYFNGNRGVVLHPFNSFTGYSVIPNGDAWFDIVDLTPDIVRVAWSISEGEVAGHIHTRDVNIVIESRIDLTPIVIEPPPIDPEPPMNVPYEMDTVNAINAQYPHLLQTNSGETCGEFTERVVVELAKKDDKWGHVGKRPGQNQYNGHAIDAVMYRSDDIPDNVVDIINSSGDGVPTTPSWGEKGAFGQPWMPPIPVDGETEPGDSTHLYIGGENDTGFCDECGRSRFDSVHEIPESKTPHQWDPGENGEGLCDICQKDAGDPIHLGEEPPPVEPSNVQEYLDNFLESNPEAQEYITKLYHVPEGAVAPSDATYQVRLNPTANLSNHLTVAAVTTDKGTAFCEMLLSLGR